jgi:hypothetical protein
MWLRGAAHAPLFKLLAVQEVARLMPASKEQLQATHRRPRFAGLLWNRAHPHHTRLAPRIRQRLLSA